MLINNKKKAIKTISTGRSSIMPEGGYAANTTHYCWDGEMYHYTQGNHALYPLLFFHRAELTRHLRIFLRPQDKHVLHYTTWFPHTQNNDILMILYAWSQRRALICASALRSPSPLPYSRPNELNKTKKMEEDGCTRIFMRFLLRALLSLFNLIICGRGKSAHSLLAVLKCYHPHNLHFLLRHRHHSLSHHMILSQF